MSSLPVWLWSIYLHSNNKLITGEPVATHWACPHLAGWSLFSHISFPLLPSFPHSHLALSLFYSRPSLVPLYSCSPSYLACLLSCPSPARWGSITPVPCPFEDIRMHAPFRAWCWPPLSLLCRGCSPAGH